MNCGDVAKVPAEGPAADLDFSGKVSGLPRKKTLQDTSRRLGPSEEGQEHGKEAWIPDSRTIHRET